MKRLSGLKLLEEREGEGRSAQKGDRVVYNMKLFLNKGEEIQLNEIQAKDAPTEKIRTEGGTRVIDRAVVLGQREVIPAIEYVLIGMKPGGYRKIRASPHLAYRDQGIPHLIPPEAVLICEIWLRDIVERSP